MKCLFAVLIFFVLLAGCGGGGQPPTIAGPPAIEFSRVPQYGSFDNLQGRVRGVNTADVKVICIIYVVGRWWVKPYYASPFTPVRPDGTFTTDVTTGGVDEQATEIRAYLVAKDYEYTGLLPPDPPSEKVLAMAKAIRSP